MSASNLTHQVARLENRAELLEALTGQVLATLRINLDRGNIRTADDAFFRKLLDGWIQQYGTEQYDKAIGRKEGA